MNLRQVFASNARRALLFIACLLSVSALAIAQFQGSAHGEGPVVLIGTGEGGGLARLYSAAARAEIASGQPFGPGFTGGLRVAVGDVNGDGLTDFVIGAGPGSGQVRAYSGADYSQLAAFAPFGEAFTGGVYVATGDMDADGYADIIVGGGAGSGLISIVSGADGHAIASGAPFPAGYTGGVTVAAGDVNGDGRTDLIVATAVGGLVEVFDGATATFMTAGFPYGPFFFGGVNLGAGDVDGDGRDEVITAPRTGGGLVHVFRIDGTAIASIVPFPAANGVNVAAGDLDGDGTADVVVGAGSGAVPQVRVFNYRTQSEIATFLAAEPTFAGGVFVAASHGPGAGQFITPDTATFREGVAQEFAIRATGGGAVVLSMEGVLPAGLTFTDLGHGRATITGTPATGTGGIHLLRFSARRSGIEVGHQNFTLTVRSAVAITSAASTTWIEDEPSTFTFTTTGFPRATLSSSDGWPAGVTFVDQGDGTARLSGTAADAGVFTSTITATNSIGDTATQTFTLTVGPATTPTTITSANATSFTAGSAGTFTVTTDGIPAATAISVAGALPGGITFTNNGDGTAVLGGTPAAGTNGLYPLVITASNGVGTPATQNFTLTILEAPVFTSANTTTFIVGAVGTFTVTTAAEPDVTTITLGGAALPTGVGFVNNGDGTATLSGTPAAATGGAYTLTFTASNGIGGPVTQTFVLNVHAAPAITSANGATFLEETPGTFTVTATGVPAPALTAAGALPAGVTFVDNANGTATLAGTPADGSAGAYVLTLTATNGVGVPATATFTLTVENINKAPSFTRGPDQTVLEDAGAQTVAGWATAISAGANEPTQTVAFEILTNTNPSLFAVTPEVSATGDLTYTAALDANGAADITLRITDDGGTGNGGVNVSAPQTFTITVAAVNDAPTADDDGYGVAEGGTLNVAAPGVLDGDQDVEGSALSAVLVAGPANAAAFTLNANGSFTYTHNGSETTTDTFTYRANDGALDSNLATVTITVTPTNDAPVADNDAYSVNEGAALNVAAPGVLDGDTDPEGDALTAVLVTGPAQASAFTLNADGSFSYTHNGSETTTDTFTYRANDGALDSNVATVTITIAPVNDAPVATNDSYTVNEGAALTITAPGVLANDTDAEGSGLTAVLVAGPSHAVVVFNADGSFSYTHNGSETITDSFTYRANDGALDSNTATVTITITPVNDAPVATDDGYAVNEGATLAPAAPGVMTNDLDAEGNTLTASLVAGPSHAASFTLNADGSFIYTHDGTESPLSDSFTYQVSDGITLSNVATVTITITPVNEAPVLDLDANDSGGTTGADYATTFTENGSATLLQDPLDATVTDADHTTLASLTVTLTNLLDPTFELLDVDLTGFPAFTKIYDTSTMGQGVLTVTAATPQAIGDVQTLLRRVTYQHTGDDPDTTARAITFVASDGSAGSNVATSTVTIIPVDDPPTAANDGYTVAESGTLNVAAPGVLDNDSDPEGSALTAILVSGPTHVSSFTLNADGSFSYTNNGDDTTPDSFTYRAQAGGVDSNIATVTIAITDVNDAPVADDDAYTVAEGATLNVAAPGVLDGDTDAEASALTAVLVTGPAQSSAFTLNADGSFTYTHNGSETTTDTFTYRANDGALDSNLATVTITITGVNDAPVADNDAYAVNEGGTLNQSAPGVLDGDTDAEGSALTAVLAAGPSQASAFTLNADGSFTYTHNGSETITDSFTYRANDGALDSNIATVTITITPINDAPVASDDGYAVNEGATLAPAAPGVMTNDLDAEGNTLMAALVAGPSHAASFTLNADGSFTYTHNGSESPLSDSFTYLVNDGSANSNVATVTLTITAVNDLPVIDLDADDSGGTTGVDYAVTFNENGAAPFLQDAADATITDGDNTTLASITVTLTNLLDPTFELLDVDLTGLPAFTKTYDTTTDPTQGVLTIAATPAQPIADFVTLLRRVTYLNSDEAPDTTARIVSFVANDGDGDGPPATTTVTIVAADDPPTADNDAYSVDEGGTLNVAAPGVLDGDQDPEGDALTAVLVTGPATASSFTLNADGSFSYTHDGSETTTDSYTYRASANSLQSADATVTITITAINDPPTAVDDAGATTEDAVLNAAAPGVLANDTDPDAGDTKTVVAVNGSAGNVGTPTTTAEGATVTLNADGSYSYDPTGVAAFQALGTGQTDTDTFTYTMADSGSLQSTATVTITITGVNDAAVVAVGAGTPTFTEDGAPVAVAAALTVTDADDTNLDSATVQITGNYQNGQDELVFTNQFGITGVWTPATGTLALTGSATVANYQTALRSVTYRNTSQNPNTTARTVSFLVNDGEVNSNTDTKSVTVVSVNDAPTATAGATITFTEGNAATPIDTTIVVNDVDDTNLESATVQITANYVNGQDILAMPVTPGIASAFNAVTGALTLTGSATVAAYQAALRTVTYFNGSNNPSQLARTVTWVINDGDVNSAGATSTITVIAVNDPPTVLPETFELLGNTELRVDMTAGTTPHTSETTSGGSAVEGVLDNDSDPEGDPFAVTAIANCVVPDTTPPFDCTLTGGAVVHVDANGEFSYTPAPGATSGSFTYTVTDTPSQGLPSSVTGTVTFTFFDMIWYVDGTVTGPGTGTSIDPFNTLTATNLSGVGGSGDLDDADDYIFVHDSTINSGIELETGQHLLAEFVGLSINRNLNGNGAPTNLVTAGGARTVLTNAAGNAIAIGSAMPAEIQGFALTGSVNAIDVTTAEALTGSSTLTIANNEIVSAGAEGIDVTLGPGTTGTLTLNVQNNSWNTLNTHGPNAVEIIRNAGTLILDFSGNTNIKSSIRGLVIDGGGVANTFITGFANNSIHQSTLGHAITISNVTFDANVVTGGIQQVNGGTLNVGVSGSPVGTRGVQLLSVQGNLLFTDLDVFASESGLTVSGTGSGMALSVTPVTSGGTSTIVAQGGAAVDASSVALDLRLSSLTSTTPASGVSLATVSGQFSAAAGSITKASGGGTAFTVSNSNAVITYSGALNVTSGAGVSLTTNTGSVITFNGGMTLSTGANAGFTATGGGTVNVCALTSCSSGSAVVNTIVTTTATALNVANTTIGSGLTFRSINVDGNDAFPVNGIVLNNTGTTAGLTVTGTGGANSGGTIQDTSGDAISLNSTAKLSLTSMNITSNLGSGIRGTTVDGFVLASCSITSNGDSAASDEAGLFIENLTGTASGGTHPTSITNSTISNNWEFEIQITNNSASATTLTNLQMSGNTISADGTQPNHGNLMNFLAVGTGTHNMTLNLTSGSFTGNTDTSGGRIVTATGLQCDHSGSSGTMTCNVSGATFANNNVGPQASVAANGNVVIDFNGNTITGTRSHGINLFADANAPFTKSISGRIRNNVVGTVGVPNSGSSLGPGIRVQNEGSVPMTLAIENNTVQNTQSFQGINVNVGISIASALGGAATNLTIFNNSFNNIGSRAIAVQDNDLSTGTKPTVCVNMTSNFFGAGIAGQAGDGSWVRLRELSGTFNVTQASPTTAVNAAELDDQQDNGNDLTGTKYAISGTPQFSQPACPQP